MRTCIEAAYLSPIRVLIAAALALIAIQAGNAQSVTVELVRVHLKLPSNTTLEKVNDTINRTAHLIQANGERLLLDFEIENLNPKSGDRCLRANLSKPIEVSKSDLEKWRIQIEPNAEHFLVFCSRDPKPTFEEKSSTGLAKFTMGVYPGWRALVETDLPVESVLASTKDELCGCLDHREACRERLVKQGSRFFTDTHTTRGIIWITLSCPIEANYTVEIPLPDSIGYQSEADYAVKDLIKRATVPSNRANPILDSLGRARLERYGFGKELTDMKVKVSTTMTK